MKLYQFLLFIIISLLTIPTYANTSEKQQVAITAIVEHPALNEIRRGIIEQLAREGFIDSKNININYQNAQGSVATAAQIARKFVSDKPAVIIPIATPSAQTVAAATRTIPIVFSAITDPIAAKLVKNFGKNEGNVAGVSDQIPLAPQIDLILQLVPNVKSIGYIYNPGEINSVATLAMLEKEAAQKNITIIPAPAIRTADISTAALSLVGKVQAIYTPTDNNVVSAYEALYKIAIANKIPLIAADFGSVERGAIAALATDQYNIGVETGKMAAKILRGVKIDELETVRVENLNLYLNKHAAQLQGVKIPDFLLKNAASIIE